MSDIVERLRDEVVGVGDEAAAEIVRLRAERKILEEARNSLVELLAAAEAERDRLRDALKDARDDVLKQAIEACWKTQKEVEDGVKAGGVDVPFYRMACQDCAEAIAALKGDTP